MEPKIAFALDVFFAIFTGGLFFRSSFKGLKDHKLINNDRQNILVSSIFTAIVFVICLIPSNTKIYDYIFVAPHERTAANISFQCSKNCGGEICVDQYTSKYPHGTHFNEVVSTYMRASNSQICQLHGQALAETTTSQSPTPAAVPATPNAPAKPSEQSTPDAALPTDSSQSFKMSQRAARLEIADLTARAIKYDGAFRCGSGRVVSGRIGKILNESNIDINVYHKEHTPAELAMQSDVAKMLQSNSRCSALMSGKANEFCERRADEQGIPNKASDKYVNGEDRLKFVRACSIAVVSGTDDYPNWKYPKQAPANP